MTWFNQAGYGIFLHWGAYSQTGGRWKGQERNRDLWGEWIKNRASISTADYQEMAKSFNPSEFNPKQWAEIFKESGAQYVVLTAKHHEGFAMYHSAASKFNSYDWPINYHGEPVKELGDAVRAAGLKFGVYYSQKIDWTNQKWQAPFSDYFNTICKPQVEELTTQYGPMAVIWFDIGVGPEDADQLKAIVRKNQPQAIISPRIGAGRGDYAGGGDNEIPTSRQPSPWESCMTLTQHWASYPQDISQKSVQEVIRMLVDIRSKGGNMLLDIGPDSKGNLAPRDVFVIRQVGQWIRKNSDAIYGVSASPLALVPWGCITAKNNMLYLHVFDLPSRGEVLLPGVKGKIESAWVLGDPGKTPLPVVQEGSEDYRIALNVLSAPKEALDPNDMVVAVKLAEGVTFDEELLVDDDLTNEFHPAQAKFSGDASYGHPRAIYSQVDEPAVERARYDEVGKLIKPESSMDWNFRSSRDADYHVVLKYAWKEAAPGTLTVKVDDEVFSIQVPPTAGTMEHPFTQVRLGTVALRKSGEHKIHLESNVNGVKAKDGGVLINQLELVPSRTTLLESSVGLDGKSLHQLGAGEIKH